MLYQSNREIQIIHNQKIYFEPHLHRELEIIALFHGSADVTVNGKVYPIHAGDFVVIFPYMVHSYTLGENVDVGKFIFGAEDMCEGSSILRKKRPCFPVIPRETIAGTNLADFTQEILARRENCSAMVKKAYLHLLAARLFELCEMEDTNEQPNLLISDILDYCQTHYQKDISVSDVAQNVHVSKSYISHIFCQNIKMNFCNYINALRLEAASDLLRRGEGSITEISERCGFQSIRTFNRAFLKQMGMTPREYRIRYS